MTDPLAIWQKWATEIVHLAPYERRPILLAWARRDDLTGFLFAEEPLSDIAAEAIRTLHAELASDTPANAWTRAPFKAGRSAIYRALKIDPAEPTAFYATFPFRLLQIADQNWIAAAINAPDLLSFQPYSELDITNVILWNPKTGEVRLLGDKSTTLIAPADRGARLTIYADGFSFFRAWADRRSEDIARAWKARREKWVHPMQRIDELPGALIIGDIDKAMVPLDVAVLEAGPGVDPKKLNKAIYRHANLPRVQPFQRAA